MAALALVGADVALAYHSSQGIAKRAVASVLAVGRRAVAIEADLSRSADCVRLVNEAAESLEGLDVLVNMASVYTRRAYNDLREVDWDGGLAVDLKASFLCAQAAVPHMRVSGGGRIVNLADWVAAAGRPRYRASCRTTSPNVELSLLPKLLRWSWLTTKNWSTLWRLVRSFRWTILMLQLAAAEQVTPLGRWGGDEAVVKAVLTLIETDFMTGDPLRVGGRRHLR